MAHFYGSIRGQRGEASRLGSKASGLSIKAASWQGAVSVYLYEQTGTDMARVEFVRHHNAGTERPLYDGPVSGKEN